jgi:squalene-hopene/tetraprenyl-beta-curcumene cyclase
MLGQIPYDVCPAVPPEFVLLPRRSPVNIYKISAWSRTIFVPLSLVWAHQPVRSIPPELGIRELFLREPHEWPRLVCPGRERKLGRFSWESIFFALDGLIKWCERWHLMPLRRWAIDAATRWMIERFEDSDGLGAIYPPIIWSVVALRCLGHREDSRLVRYNLDELEKLTIRQTHVDGRTTSRLQPCRSPVWDTAIAVRAIAASGATISDAPLEAAVRWLLAREITAPGDWAQSVRGESGGWSFEYANRFYADVDDTAMVLLALRESLGDNWMSTGRSEGSVVRMVHQTSARSVPAARDDIWLLDRLAAAAQRGVRWLLAMQNNDGGWGAFDRNNDREILCRVPFADHNAMIDPSTPDLAGRVLEALGAMGRRVGDPAVDRAIVYLHRTQQADGSWPGRWGVNCVYGTWQVLVGLQAVGVPAANDAMIAGANWLIAHQQPSGGWGESPDSYRDPAMRGRGPSTASQTSWAILGLLAAGKAEHAATRRGVEFLLNRQQDDGSWDEPEFTGTGFPLVFYLRYHLYRIYFPLLALSRYAAASVK